LERTVGRFGVLAQILADNWKVFTGKCFTRQVEVLFDKICRENGLGHILTAPYSQTTTGKVEGFHRSQGGRVSDRLRV
jgi:hypothetical protein